MPGGSSGATEDTGIDVVMDQLDQSLAEAAGSEEHGKLRALYKEFRSELTTQRTQLTKTHSIPAASLINGSLSALAGNIGRLSMAVRHNDSTEIAIASMDMIGAVVPICGLLGPMGMLFGGIVQLTLQFISGILKAVGPLEKPLIDRIKELLDKFRSEELVDQLNSVFGLLEIARANLEKLPEASSPWHEILGIAPFTSGGAELRIGDAESWLGRPEKQKLAEWQDVLIAYCQAVHLHIGNIVIAHTKVLPTPREAGQAVAVAQTMLQQYRDFIETIVPIAQAHGSMWHLGDNRQLYTRIPAGQGDWLLRKGESEEVVVHPDSGRYWTLEGGVNGRLWTGIGGSWTDDFTGEPSIHNHQFRDLWILPENGEDARVFAVRHLGKSVLVGRWHEADQRFSDVSSVIVTGLADHDAIKCLRVARDAETGRELLYVLSQDSRLYWSAADDRRHWGILQRIHRSPMDPAITGLSVTEAGLWVYSRSAVWSVPHSIVTQDEQTWGWTEEVGLVDEGLELEHFFACNDGTVTTIKGGRLALWKKQDPKGTWKKITQDDAVAATRAFKTSVKGWGLLGSVRAAANQTIPELPPEDAHA